MLSVARQTSSSSSASRKSTEFPSAKACLRGEALLDLLCLPFYCLAWLPTLLPSWVVPFSFCGV